MQAQAGIGIFEKVRHLLVDVIHLVIRSDDGVHVDANGHVHLLADFALGIVDHLMDGHDIGICADLRMHRGDAAARSIVMKHQVMNAQNPVSRQQQLADLADFFRVRLAAQQAVHRIAAYVEAPLQPHSRHQQANPAVDGPVESKIGQHAEQHRAGREHVAQAVLGGGQQCAVMNGVAQLAVEKEQPQLQQHGCRQSRDHHPRQGERFRMEDGGQAVAQKLQSHQQDQPAHRQRTQVLHASMAEGVLLVHGLAGQARGDERHDAAGGVGKVVGGVGHDSQRTAEQPHEKLACG